jgi:hypothetical protein
MSHAIRMTKSRMMFRAGHVVYMGEKRSEYMILVEKSEGRKPPERPKFTWEDIIKMVPR